MKKWFEQQEHLFYVFLFILMIPNILLCATEAMSLGAKWVNLCLPFALYYGGISLAKRCGRTVWVMFLFLFLGAFQLVLLYLFGKSVIAVDMFLNLLTTNASEALELLDNLWPAIVGVVLLYVPLLVWASVSFVCRWTLKEEFLKRSRRRAGVCLAVGLLSLGGVSVWDEDYEFKSDFFPVNVCYNAWLAVRREVKTRMYEQTSAGFSFRAVSTRDLQEREVYVMVVGETSRALNWQLYGYGRETNPRLSAASGLVVFTKVLSESNTTHKSVPLLLADLDAHSFDSVYYRKGVLTAFKEAGFRTAFFSNQRYNHSFIDFFGEEADTVCFIKEDCGGGNPGDMELLDLLAKEVRGGSGKLFVVLHMYGSHFCYKDRYPEEYACFLPDFPLEVSPKSRESLINAYDNTIRYTDDFLFRLAELLGEQRIKAAFIYTSDHGEDLFDDRRHLFLHASPVPSAYQIYVPFLVWTSPEYASAYPEKKEALTGNAVKNVSSSASFFHTMLDLGGVETCYFREECSVASPLFKEAPRVYLNDHNEARPLGGVKMEAEDFELFRKWKVDY